MANKKTLKGIDDNTVVHCKTLKEAEKATAIAEKAGFTWINQKKFSEGSLKWEVRKEKTCYSFYEGVSHDYDYFKSEGYNIMSAEEFIKKNSEPEMPNIPLTPEQLEFNLDRLATESDKVFKTQLDRSKVELKTQATSVSGEVLADLKTKVNQVKDSVTDEFMDGVKEVMRNSKELLLEELRKGRTIINVGAGEIAHSISVSSDDHYMMESVLKSILLHKKILLVGEAGTGKTFMGSSIAEKLKLNFYKYSCSRDSSVHDLLGYKQPRSETYLSTTFLQAYENGGIFLCDEFDAMPGDVALFFNGIADSSKSISIPHRDENPIAKRHKDFYLIMCGNTWGKGSQDYSGRDFQDMALLDRFRLCRHHIGYDSKLEKSMVGETMYGFVSTLRELMTSIGSYLSTRNVEDIGLLLRSGESIDYVLRVMSADLEEEDKRTFANKNLSNAFSSDYQKFVFDMKREKEEAEKQLKKA